MLLLLLVAVVAGVLTVVVGAVPVVVAGFTTKFNLLPLVIL